MKKKILCILMFILLVLGITGCSNNNVNNNLASLEIKDGTLTNTGATLILTNHSNQDYSYGNPYYIEKEINDNWEKLETINELVFNLPAWSLKGKESVEINVDWEYGYGKLEPGKYRIVKEIFKTSDTTIDNSVKFQVAAEFVIE